MIKEGNISKLEVAGLLALNYSNKTFAGGWTMNIEKHNETDYEDEGPYKIISFSHPEHEKSYWQITGWYDSYEGDLHWDHSTLKQVFPTTKEVTVYE